jgi:type II secretory pathway pseudopilin PulG
MFADLNNPTRRAAVNRVSTVSCSGDEHNSTVAFTLLEVLTVIVVIIILVLLLIPAISSMRARAQRVQCMANLRSLYIAAESCLQQNGSWPQIAISDSDSAEEEYARAWIAVLTPFGTTQKNWICPTIQTLLSNPDLSDSSNVRVDYIAMPFDDKPLTPHRWSSQPWFIEVGDVHGNGNLMVFTDGSIKASKELQTATSPAPSAPASQ